MRGCSFGAAGAAHDREGNVFRKLFAILPDSRALRPMGGGGILVRYLGYYQLQNVLTTCFMAFAILPDSRALRPKGGGGMLVRYLGYYLLQGADRSQGQSASIVCIIQQHFSFVKCYFKIFSITEHINGLFAYFLTAKNFYFVVSAQKNIEVEPDIDV